MGIIDENQKEIIRLGTLHSAVFKISLYVMPIVLGYFISMVLRHDTQIAVMEQKMSDFKTLSLGIRSQLGKLPGQLAKAKPESSDDN